MPTSSCAMTARSCCRGRVNASPPASSTRGCCRDGPGHGGRMSLIERSFREKIVLVGVTLPPVSSQETDEHLAELALLVNTAGADEVARVVQRRDAPDPATYVGKGKAEELRELTLEV